MQTSAINLIPVLLALCWTSCEAVGIAGWSQSSGSGGGGGCSSGCCNLGSQVFSGSCSSFAQAFSSDADAAMSEGNDAFQNRVNNAPQPSSACCISARAYTQYGCACSQDLINAAASRGISSNGVRVVARATQFSICANSANGGHVSAGC